VLLSYQETLQELANLSRAVPHLLQDNRGSEFWAEFLGRANALKDHVPLDLHDWVTEKIYEVLANNGLPPPSRWILDSTVLARRAPDISGVLHLK
jgi:hypothetical protein